jgi:hypothetical protein
MKDGRCSATNKDGRPCSAQAWRDQLCRWHHPDLEAARVEGRRRGGKNRSNATRARKQLAGDVRDMTDVKARLMIALDKVEKGELEPNVVTAMANVARAIATVAGVADFEGQLAELRHEVASLAESSGA